MGVLGSTAVADRAAWRRSLWSRAVELRRRTWGRALASRRAVPDFLVLGAQRSGSTSLYRLLSNHPDVTWPALVKSPHWLDANYDRDESWYRSHFPLRAELDRHDPPRSTGEAAPYLLYHPAVPGRIARHLPDVRSVAILRDPVTRAWSHYQHELARGKETLGFAEALDAEDERIAPELPHLDEPGFVGPHHRRHGYVRRGLYAEQLQRHLDVVGPDRLLVLFTDELKREPQATFDRLCDFLGLRRIELDMPSRHHTRDYDELDPAIRARLEERFAGPDRDLAELLGRPVPWTRDR